MGHVDQRYSTHIPVRRPTVSYVILSPTSVHSTVEALGGYRTVLGAAEAQRASKLQVHQDAAAFLASRALARMLVSWYRTGSADAAADVSITRICMDCGESDHGKPQTSDLAVSLSRTREMVMAAIGPQGLLLGVDIERGEALTPPGVFKGFDAMVLTSQERELVSASPHPDRLRLAAWSGKEALLKATGDGLRIDPTTVPVLHRSDRSPGATDSWNEVASPQNHTPRPLYLRWVYAGAHHVASVVVDATCTLTRLPPGELGLEPGPRA